MNHGKRTLELSTGSACCDKANEEFSLLHRFTRSCRGLLIDGLERWDRCSTGPPCRP